jgi:hypothetical protein
MMGSQTEGPLAQREVLFMKRFRNVRNSFRMPMNHPTIPIPLTLGMLTVVVIAGIAGAQNPNVSSPLVKAGAGSEDTSIRPFHVSVPEEQLVDLRKRIAATRWPEKETVADQSQGVQLATIQKLARYWGTDYDWRKYEAKLNALPQFVTKIDGLDIHFIHFVRSMKMLCRSSSSRTDGPARSSSS